MTIHALIMAGGTGGHVIPALAVAKKLRESGARITWLGSDRGIENEIVPKHDFPLERISIAGVRGGSILKKILSPFVVLVAIIQVLKIIYKLKPSIVIGFGGYVSFPGGVAAVIMDKPLFIHEQNIIPGLANKLLYRFSTKAFTGFPNVFPNSKNTQYVGNPVRDQIVEIDSPEKRFSENNDNTIRLLVFGGSQGSGVFNKIVPEAIRQLKDTIHLHVWHQTGAALFEETKYLYNSIGVDSFVDDFIDDMACAYNWADIVISRSGALSVAEISVVGVASILVPYPFAVDDHQEENAKFLTETGAAVLLLQQDFTVENLCNHLKNLCFSKSNLLEMARRARNLRKIDATELIVNGILNHEK